MNIIIKLLPPFNKIGEKDGIILTLPAGDWDLERLAHYLTVERKDLIAFDLVDVKGHFAAEFIINGSHAPLQKPLSEGDEVTVIPYICGG